MPRRFQFSLRTVFVVTTLAAIAVAACQSVGRIWDSFLPLAAMLLMAIPLLLLPAIFSAIRAVGRQGTEGEE